MKYNRLTDEFEDGLTTEEWWASYCKKHHIGKYRRPPSKIEIAIQQDKLRLLRGDIRP